MGDLRVEFSDPFEFHRFMMKQKHGQCGPYRLGISVGFYGDDLPAPYTNEKSIKVYNDGIETGRRLAAENHVLYRPEPKQEV